MVFEKRVDKLVEALGEVGCDGLLVTNLTNVYYLTGFHGTAGTVFVSPKHRLFVTDARYSLIAKESITGFDIIESRDAFSEIAKRIKDDKFETLGFDSEVSYSLYQTLSQVFEGYKLQATSNVIESLRMVKDEHEVAIIKKACQISDQAFLDVLDFIKPNVTTELEVANFLDFRMRELGASGPSFEFIVASGERSSMPHGVASHKVIRDNEMLTMDFGYYYQHYVSDMTRTVHVGAASDEEKHIYETVLASNQALLDVAKAGMTYRDYDRVARQVIDEAGYGAYFTHGIGHGIGLDIHEIPYFGKSDDKLQAGMALTDEPGIYIDGKYGVRIEDDLLVTEEGCELLTLAPKELLII